MANVLGDATSQSFGAMYSIDIRKYKETEDSYAYDLFQFNWRYINTYDKKRGTAKVQVTGCCFYSQDRSRKFRYNSL